MRLENLVRLGYATKGFVYALIGMLAVTAAFGQGGQTTDAQGALRAIAVQPFGQFLLILITIGLAGYALWRFIEAIQDPEHQRSNDAEGIFRRIGYAISGLIYGGLAFNSALLVFGSNAQTGGSSQQDWTARLLQQPFGKWLLGLVGAIIIGVGFYLIYKAYKTKFTRELDLSELDHKQHHWVVNISRLGIIARGIVFSMIGFFIIQAARNSDANEVKGLDGALQTLGQQPYGKILLTVVALGLVAYGIYMWIQARYRRLQMI